MRVVLVELSRSVKHVFLACNLIRLIKRLQNRRVPVEPGPDEFVVSVEKIGGILKSQILKKKTYLLKKVKKRVLVPRITPTMSQGGQFLVSRQELCQLPNIKMKFRSVQVQNTKRIYLGISCARAMHGDYYVHFHHQK